MLKGGRQHSEKLGMKSMGSRALGTFASISLILITIQSGTAEVHAQSPASKSVITLSKGVSGVGDILWEEDFSSKTYTKLNPLFWTKNLGNYRRELPVKNSPENVYISGKSKDKNLEILTAKINRPSLYKGWCSTAPCDFTSGEITTRDKLIVKYGFIEARIKMPSGSGNWPAFWMLPDGNYGDSKKATPGEIDIVEWYGNKPSFANFTLHSNTPPGNVNDSQVASYFDSKLDLSNSFHVYGIAWAPGSISSYLDNKLIKTYTSKDLPAWPFDEYFYLILQGSVGPQPNTIFGGNWSGWKSSTMKISWVRISKYLNNGTVLTVSR